MRSGWAVRVAFRAAWSCLRRHRWRSLLTLAVCGLGTAGIITAGVLAKAHIAEVQASVRTMGGGLIVVSPNRLPPYPGRPRQLEHFISLKPEDGIAIASEVADVQAVVSLVARDAVVRLGSTATRVRLVGTTPEFFKVRGFALAHGRFFEDEEHSQRVIVFGHAVRQELMPAGILPGRDVYLEGIPYRVVGVLQPQGMNFAGEDEDRQVFIPLDTYRRGVANRPWLNFLYVLVAPQGDSVQTADDVQQLLRDRHGRWRDEVEDVIVRDFADITAMQSQMLTTATWTVSVTSGLFLIMGGVGIATLMILVVRERRTEISLRRALGATPADVALQFFLEGIVLAAAGVLAGLGLGIAAATCLVRIRDVSAQLDPTLLLVSIAVSLLCSAAACTFPAILASRMEPGPILRA